MARRGEMLKASGMGGEKRHRRRSTRPENTLWELGRPTIHQIAARALAIVSFELRVKPLMPFIVADPVVSFFRPPAYTKKHAHCAAKKGDVIPPRNVHSIT